MKSHKLLIMRHAKSDWNAGLADFERPLNQRGIKSAKKISKKLEEDDLVPDSIVSSPAKRTRDTVKILCENLNLDEKIITWDKRIYEASLTDLLNVIDELKSDAKCQLIVGHNPGLDELVNYLSSDEPQYNETGKLMTTAAVAVFDFGKKQITPVKKSAQLINILRPKEI